MSLISQAFNSPDGKKAAAEVDRRIKAAVQPIQKQLNAAVADIAKLQKEIEALKGQK
jgi:hypothetical protein